MQIVSWSIVVCLTHHAAIGGSIPQLARTPPRGFATWNMWPFSSGSSRPCYPPTCVPARNITQSVNETQCKHWAQALLDTGLVHDGGFEYFIVQEPCFGVRDNLTGQLTETGEFRSRWPNGMAAFARWLNARGMKLGIYTDIGAKTCAGCIGSGGYVKEDMATFASWGVDLVEVDACNGNIVQSSWKAFHDAIMATGRPMVHSVCAEGYDEVWTWGRSVGNMWRVAGDIQDGFLNVLQNIGIAMSIPHLDTYAGPGGWNDMDMLEIGAEPSNFSWGGPGLTFAEARAHFTLWSVLKSPLLLGADASLISKQILEVLKNQELRAIHEDTLGRQARRINNNYPGYHSADEPTIAVIKPCNASDPQQLWGSSYGNKVDMPVVGVTDPPIPRIRNSGAATFCLSTQDCQPNASSTPLYVRQCDDWNVDNCSPFQGGGPFQGQVFTPQRLPAGETLLVANVSANNSDPARAQKLCVATPSGSIARLEPCSSTAAAAARWRWDIDPATSGDAHPNHPGTLIQSVRYEGMCLSTAFTEDETNEVYIAELSKLGSWVIVFFNRTPLSRSFSIKLDRLSGSIDKWTGRDIWEKKTLGTLTSSHELTKVVAPHDVGLFRLDPFGAPNVVV